MTFFKDLLSQKLESELRIHSDKPQPGTAENPKCDAHGLSCSSAEQHVSLWFMFN